MKTGTWRFIDTGPLTGAENMAIDEALLACFTPGKSLPVLRLYGWNPPAFSCGRFQKPAEIINLDSCRADGVQVVKRITGGGVIYHAAELTYSLVCPTGFVSGCRGVKDAFFQLTSFLVKFYRSLGLEACHAAQYHTGSERLGERTALCFAGVESCDILTGGRKIGGNAQRRLKNVIFQHGSIPLRQMVDEGNPYLLQPDYGVAGRTTSLEEQGVTVVQGALAALLKRSFAENFKIDFKDDELTAAEREAASGSMQKME